MGNMSMAVAVVACLALATMLAMPRLKLGGLGGGQTTDAAHCTARVAALEVEVAQLRKALTTAQSLTSGSQKGGPSTKADISNVVAPAGSAMDPVVPIDLHRMLGVDKFFSGVSFDTLYCGVPLETVYPELKTTEALGKLVARFTADLAYEMGRILDKKVSVDSSWREELYSRENSDWEEASLDKLVRDPRTPVWRDAISRVMARYIVHPNSSFVLWCPDAPAVAKLSDLGKDPCPKLLPLQIGQQIGYHALPHISIKTLAHDALKWGVCTKPPELRRSFGQWLSQERMFNPEWATYAVHNPQQDAVLLMYDVLYESLGVFKQQYWLGAITMQNPNDMFSISDIISTIKPDLIIETGTANGGSALLWASLMHLNDIHNGRVITIDIEAPHWDPSASHWGGIVRQDATKHALWKKHVTFVKSDTLQPDVVQRVKEAASKAKIVMVLLDSNHAAAYVKQEMDTYCPMVSVGSYCIVEDTKMSRWSSNGPLEAVKLFMAEQKGAFEMDRERELLYTHHAMGYLRRER